RVNRSRDKAIALQALQRQGQHALRDTLDQLEDLSVTPRSKREHADHQHGPLVADARQYVRERAALLGGVASLAHIDVRIAQNSASLCNFRRAASYGNEQNVPSGHSVSGSDRCSSRTRRYQGDQARYEALTHRLQHFRRSVGQPATYG